MTGPSEPELTAQKAEFQAICRFGELEELKEIVSTSTFELSFFLSSDDSKWIFYLTGNGHVECLKYLFSLAQNDANKAVLLESAIKSRNDAGNTPLHWAALNGHTSMCELLLAHGANPTLRNSMGLSPATLAEQREFMDCANVLLKSYDPDQVAEEDGAEAEAVDGPEEDIVISSQDPEYQEYAAASRMKKKPRIESQDAEYLLLSETDSEGGEPRHSRNQSGQRLLPGGSNHQNYESIEEAAEEEDLAAEEDEVTFSWPGLKRESLLLLNLSWPVVITNLLQFVITSISVLSLGHISTEALAAISLASLFVNTTGTCVAQGIASALDTLCSQSFTGSTDYFAIGYHLQRGLLVSLFMTLPLSIMWWFSGSLLLLLGQDEEVSMIAGTFIRYMVPGLFPMFVNESLRKFLFAQGIMKPSMYITVVSATLSVFLQWLLVWSPTPLNLGVIGAPISTTIVNTVSPALTLLYIFLFKGGERIGPWSLKELFHGKKILEICMLGLPGTFMVVSEWLCFEAAALAAGMISTDSLAAQTIVINSISILWQIPFGLATATTTRIGNSLGSNNPNAAKRVAHTALLFSLVPAIVNMTLLLVFRHKWGYIFSDSESVAALVANILPLGAFYQLADASGTIGGGVIRGCGLQKIGFMINMVGYYVIGVPIGILLTFYFNYGLFGIWAGLTIGLLVVSTCQVIITLRMDWNRQVNEALKRVGHFEAPL